jgi:hypothetical protein
VAYEALARWGELDRIDAVGVLIHGLDETRASDCDTRKWYVTALAEHDGDDRVLPALKNEQGKKAGFLFFKTDANKCMKDELDRLIADLED